MYQYQINEASQLIRQELPSAFWSSPESDFLVYIDGILQRKTVALIGYDAGHNQIPVGTTAYLKDGMYFYPYMKWLTGAIISIGYYRSAWIDTVTPMTLGMVVKLVSTEVFDGWYHLDIRKLLIQGANPDDAGVRSINQNFQGGYRVDYQAIDNVKYGQLRRCDYQLGWDYKPPAGYRGIDSFSYRLVTAFGQESEPACCSIRVGY